MKKWVRAILYLLLNILVSALTITGVLWLWETYYPSPCKITPSPITSMQSPVAPQVEITQQEINYDDTRVVIEGVFGIGQYDVERIFLVNEGPNSVELANWVIENKQFGNYIIPGLKLNKDGAININSRSGNDSVIELFWGGKQAIWKPGDVVTLKDPNGEVRATYQIP